jgi:hypothetical protein
LGLRGGRKDQAEGQQQRQEQGKQAARHYGMFGGIYPYAQG